MSDCLFCRIVEGEIPAEVVYEDALVRAFMDTFPATKGHVLVVPKQHVANLYEATWDQVEPVFATAHRLGPVVAKAVGAAGFRLLMNNGTSVGQTVLHAHVHLMPFADGEAPTWTQLQTTREASAEVAQAIRNQLNNV